jgi:acyl-CoA reductase-like NAD-dependent aldehyde dehydrogenase
VGIPSEYLSAALAAGNTVVWKPAPTSSIIAVRLVECFLEAGVPEGAVNLLFGEAEVGDKMVANPGTHAVGLTGSSAVGNAVAQRAGAKPTLLELGGNGPTIILDDADLERAIEGIAFGCYFNTGQICQSSERILTHDKVHDAVLEGPVEKARAIKLGHPLDETTTMRPLNNEGVAKKMDEHLADAVQKGATVVTGGQRAEGFPTTLYYEPTVVDGVPADSLFNHEETFGPVAPVISTEDPCIPTFLVGLVSHVAEPRELAAGPLQPHHRHDHRRCESLQSKNAPPPGQLGRSKDHDTTASRYTPHLRSCVYYSETFANALMLGGAL